MIKSTDVKYNYQNETYQLSAKIQLQNFGSFLDKHNHMLQSFTKQLPQSVCNCNDVNPITMNVQPEENISLLQLVHSDNKLLSRILASLASLCSEINFMCNEAKNKYFTKFIFYGEVIGKGTENLQIFSRLLETLQQLNFFVRRSQHIISLLLHQLSAISGKELYVNNSTLYFPEPLDHLAELLVCLMTLDGLLVSTTLQEHWILYKRAIKSTLHNPSQFGVPIERLKFLSKILIDIESELLTGNIFQQIIEKCVQHKSMMQVKTSGLKNEFAICMHNMLLELEKDDENISYTQIWLQVNAIFVFQYHIFGNIDKKILKRLIDVNKKVCACTLYGNVLWYPEQFLIKHVPIISKLFDEKLFLTNRQTHIANRSQHLLKDSYILCTQGTNWMIQMETMMKIDYSYLKIKQLNQQYLLFIQGIKLMKRTSEIVKWITNIHAYEGRPMTKTVVLVLCRLIELLQSFYLTMQRHSISLVHCIYLVSQHIAHQALTIIAATKKGIVQDKSYNEQHLDVLSSLNVAERVLNGPYTSNRILVTRLALSAAGLNYAQAEDALSQLRGHLSRLELICNVKQLLYKLCDCSFLYWHQVIMPVYFSCLFESRSDISRMLLMFNALTDCESNGFASDGNKISSKIIDIFGSNFTQPLCQSIETNLRLLTHSHLQMSTPSPFQENYFENQLLQKRNQHSFKFVDEYISLSGDVEHYLSTMFYNLTTVVLHDWQTYGEMRQLATLKYGLVTIQDHLPMQTLEQGLDVLEIMRNIHVFVSKYLYNMNNQIFVEEWSNNKHLNTINISHIANSIRTHGIGIMNTTVNFTYQFLQKKFYIFSQFMYDEHIKSRLLKDLRYFCDNKIDLDQMYPYERAEKFNQSIRKLGLTDNGLSYLDLFRRLISHIGNAMGYVRLIRSGGRRFLSDATCFLPTFDNLSNLNEELLNTETSELTAKAAECLQSDIKNLTDNFADATEYFKLLINAFAPAFRNPQNIHLRNFYMIVPPLTINFIEHSLTCKDRINKKNKTGAAFTDDGFAMGLAFIIQLLEQGSQLNSLYWFQSVKAKHAKERKKLEEQKAVFNKDDAKLQQTLALTEKRLNLIEQEFELLYCSLYSARIFFTDTRF